MNSVLRANREQRMPTSDGERSTVLVERLARLYTPVLADVLDRLGYRDQAMRPDIRPLSPTPAPPVTH